MTRVRSPLQLARAQGKVGRVDSAIEAMFAQHWRAERMPDYVRNYAGAIPGRALEIDFAVVPVRFGVEIQGAVHRIEEHFHRDTEKLALAMLAGWQILAVTGRQVRDGSAIVWARELLAKRIAEIFPT